MVNMPPFVTVRPSITTRGVFVPASKMVKVLIVPERAPTVRLLMVRVPGELVVVALMVTVLLPALVMRSAASLKDGADTRDQLLLFSHLPLPSIQLLGGPTPMAVVASARPRVRRARYLVVRLGSPSKAARTWVRCLDRRKVWP